MTIPTSDEQLRFDVVDPASAEAEFCLRSFFAELDVRFDEGFDPAKSISADVAELTRPAGLLMVVRDDDTPVGCGAVKLHGADRPAELKRMWVSASHRGRGLGRRILVELERLAAERGAHVVRLETNRSLVEAIALYRSAGYEEVDAFNDEPYAHHWFEKRLRARNLSDLVRNYRSRSESETADLERLRALSLSVNPWDRSTPLHATASALVVHPASRRVLLRWHERQQSWLQVGGHGDPGETDPLAIALREAGEETGLDELSQWPRESDPLHIVIVPVTARGEESAHEHVDLRYLLTTDDPDASRPESEDAPLRWLTFPEAMDLTREDNLRETIRRARDSLETTSPAGA